jgi:hypothetical protein
MRGMLIDNPYNNRMDTSRNIHSESQKKRVIGYVYGQDFELSREQVRSDDDN